MAQRQGDDHHAVAVLGRGSRGQRRRRGSCRPSTRSWWLIWTSAILPRLPTIQKATSETRDPHVLPGACARCWHRSAARRLVVGERSGDRVPRRQQVVERHGEVSWPGRPREARGRVHRVVDCRRAIVVADDVDHDQVGSPLAEPLVVEEAAGGEVRQEQARVGPRSGDQRGDDLAPLLGAEVDLDRALALVEPGPEEAVRRRRSRASARGPRPPPMGSKRITSAPSWASVIPPSGAATKAEPSTTRRPVQDAAGIYATTATNAPVQHRRRVGVGALSADQRAQRRPARPDAVMLDAQLGAQDVALEHRSAGARSPPTRRSWPAPGMARVGVRGGDRDGVTAVDQAPAVGAAGRVGVRGGDVERQARQLRRARSRSRRPRPRKACPGCEVGVVRARGRRA